MAQPKVSPAPAGWQQQQPVGQQPTTGMQLGPPPPVVWMPAVTARIPDCPPGLEYLSAIDQIIVHELLNIAEVLTGFDLANKYEIKNSVGQNCYFAVEESGFCSRYCLGSRHPFDMKVLDNTGREVMTAIRPYRCSSCLYGCCLQTLTVEAPTGVTVELNGCTEQCKLNIVLLEIGRVDQDCTCCAPVFRVSDAEGNVVLRIEGPACMFACYGDIVFHIKSADGAVELGKITRQWPGLLNEYFTNVGVSFPMDLDVKVKATLLGATFLIDYMYFEESARGHRKHHHHHI